MEILIPAASIDVTLPTRLPIAFTDVETGAFDFDCKVTDEGNRTETTYVSQLGTYSNDQSRLVITATIAADTFYYIVAYQGTTELVKFKIFCTAQTDLQNYQITLGEFTEAPQSDNGFIVL